MGGEIIAFVPLAEPAEGYEPVFLADPSAWLPAGSTSAEGGSWTVLTSWGRSTVATEMSVGEVEEHGGVLARALVAAPVDSGQPSLLLRGRIELRPGRGGTALAFRGHLSARPGTNDRTSHGDEARSDAYGAAVRLLAAIGRRLESERAVAVADARTRHPSGRRLALH